MRSPRDGDNQLLYQVVFWGFFVVFFPSKKMPCCSEIPLMGNVLSLFLAYLWCSGFVQYIVLVHFNDLSQNLGMPYSVSSARMSIEQF